MCGYKRDAYPATEKELIEQVDYALSKPTPVVKIFTSGSFFDEREVSPKVREYIIKKVEDLGVEKLIVESRPEFITEKRLMDFKGINLEVGIGLETANDFIREYCINKGFGFKDFERASKLLKSYGFRVKAYLLLKPPFLSEREAIEDVITSTEKIKDLVDVVSINPTNVQKDTFVERLWKKGLYRPPWLWSAVEVLKRIEIDAICDPVAAGKIRGPHNCGKCDRIVAKAIRDYSLFQDKTVFESLNCDCIAKWRRTIELEDYTRIPLFK